MELECDVIIFADFLLLNLLIPQFSIYLFLFFHRNYNFHLLPPDDDVDYVDMGAARLNFYSSLVELLGRCAPDAEVIKAGRSDSIRARAILRSLISIEDLEGVLGLSFILPVQKVVEQEGTRYIFLYIFGFDYKLYNINRIDTNISL